MPKTVSSADTYVSISAPSMYNSFFLPSLPHMFLNVRNIFFTLFLTQGQSYASFHGVISPSFISRLCSMFSSTSICQSTCLVALEFFLKNNLSPEIALFCFYLLCPTTTLYKAAFILCSINGGVACLQPSLDSLHWKFYSQEHIQTGSQECICLVLLKLNLFCYTCHICYF